MKKILIGLLSCGAAISLFTGCGGGSSSNDSTTLTTKASYTGAATAGDFANFMVKTDGDKYYIDYSINGKVFGSKKGTVAVKSKFGNVFFEDEDENSYFFSGSLGVAAVEDLDGKMAYVVGLNMPSSDITTEDLNKIVNKRFNLAEYFPDSDNFEFSLLDINSTNITDLNGTWTQYYSDGSESGTWRVNTNYIEVYDDSNNKIANVVIKPGESRNGIVVDKVDGGFAIGLEAKELNSDELTGTYYYMAKKMEENWLCYGEVNVSDTNFSYSDIWCSDNAPESDSGTLTLNPQYDPDNDPTTDNNITLNGLAKINGTNMYVFVDPQDGYYIKIDLDSTEMGIGSNKPLK